MIKGCHKRIVFLKDTQSDMFEEAYFILKPNAMAEKENDIVLEATRIVSGFSSQGSRKKSAFPFIAFFLGLGVGVLAMLIVHLILI